MGGHLGNKIVLCVSVWERHFAVARRIISSRCACGSTISQVLIRGESALWGTFIKIAVSIDGIVVIIHRTVLTTLFVGTIV